MLWELNDGRQGSLRVGSRGGEPHTSPRDLAAGDALLEGMPPTTRQFGGSAASGPRAGL